MTASSAAKTNRLASETSPYLLQHARNPVDWYPWGPEALKLAKSSDRPILLSIGYAACHWCHVMERESFENEEIAAVMNEHFVCIKVDREERPDLDDIYMAATVGLSGAGGWPMTVFLSPDGRPFFAGTYFPPEDRYGRPGFKRLLTTLAEAWQQEREQLLRQADSLTRHVRAQSQAEPPLSIGRDALAAAVETLWPTFDRRYGGFGSAPKFPPASTLQLLMRHYRQSGDLRALEMVVGTLGGMKNGGMYDHLAGGFARYSTDERWLVPHFEKMLYDNAQLVPVYLEAYQVTGREEYREVARETLDYVLREMQGPDGGYFSATDADSEGEEGKFFVWAYDEVRELLEPEDAERFCAFYDVTPEGNWEGKNVLNTPRSLAQVSKELGIEAAELAETLERTRPLMYEARQRRVPPLLDDKVLTAHNGLMLGAMAMGYQVLRDPAYLKSAERAADYLWQHLRRPDAGLFRTARAGVAHLDAYLEDYAYLCDGLISLYEAGSGPEVLERALTLGQRMLTDFADEENGGFYFTAHGHEALIARTKEGHDGALPNPNSVAARALLRLGRHFGREYFIESAHAALRAYGHQIARRPRAFSSALCAVDLALEPALELVVVGALDDPRTQELLGAVGRRFLPGKIQAVVDPHLPASAEVSPLVRDKTLVGDAPAAYLCEAFSCQAPVTSAEALNQLLDSFNDKAKSARRSEVSHSALRGLASAAATAELGKRPRAERGLTRGDYRQLSDTGVWVSAVGFGGYRLTTDAEHVRALTHALELGVNLIDTAPGYMGGDSERVIGRVLKELSDTKRRAREEVVVVSKLGTLQGATLAEYRLSEQQGRPQPELTKLSAELWHCVHPAFLERELQHSLERLGLETLDICLIHNPEYFFEAAPPEARLGPLRDEFYRRLEVAFRFLEGARQRGKIGWYGVSSNTLARPSSDRLMTDAARLLEIAERALGPGHGFKVLELPLNLAEPAAATLDDGPSPAVLEFARDRGLAVLSNRPLSAIMPAGVLPLVDPPEAISSVDLASALTSLEKFESEYRERFAPQLSAPEGALAPSQLLSWAPKLGQVAAGLMSLSQYHDLVRLIAPRLEEAVASLDRAFGARHPEWTRFRDAYRQALGQVLDAAAAQAAKKSKAELDRLRAQLEALAVKQAANPSAEAGPGEVSTAPREAPVETDTPAPIPLSAMPFAQLALAAVRQHPAVTSVLVGMRQLAYVDQAVASLRLQPFADPTAAFAGLSRQTSATEQKTDDQTADQGTVA